MKRERGIRRDAERHIGALALDIMYDLNATPVDELLEMVEQMQTYNDHNIGWYKYELRYGLVQLARSVAFMKKERITELAEAIE